MSEPRLVRPENVLEQALLDGGPAGVLAALAGADVPFRAESRDGALALGTIDVDGETYLAAFSSAGAARLASFDPGGGDYVRVPGRALAAVEPRELRLVLKPGAELGAVLEADERASLGSAPAPPEPWLLVGEPAQEPEALLAAIRALAAREPEIRAA